MSYPPPPPPPPGGYGYGPAPYGGMPPQQHGSATTALVMGILSFVCCPLLGIPALIVGRRAEREIEESRGTLTGDGLAKAGWILGLISLILYGVLAVIYVLFFLVLVGGSTMYDGPTGY